MTVLKHYGQTPAGKSKMDLYKQIFALFLESQEEQDDALHRSTMGKKQRMQQMQKVRKRRRMKTSVTMKIC